MSDLKMNHPLGQHETDLSAFNYYSKVGPDFATPELAAKLIEQFRAFNAAQGVTGAIALDNGRVRQWLEGPDAAIQRLWDRIRRDTRHRVVWAEQPTRIKERQFPGSLMRLALTPDNLARIDALNLDDVFGLPAKPCAAASRPKSDCLSCGCRNVCSMDSGEVGMSPCGETALWQLETVFRDEARKRLDHQAKELLSVLTELDTSSARAILQEDLAETGLSDLAMLLQEILALLETGWLADEISFTQRQLVLTMLQSTLRQRLDRVDATRTVGSALVSMLPGTPDVAGVMLKVALLRRAGWSVRLLLPKSTAEIIAVAHDLQPDLIVLAGSRLAASAAELRMLSEIMPELSASGGSPVVLGGKLAEVDPLALLDLGAQAVVANLDEIAAIGARFASIPSCLTGRMNRSRFSPSAVALVEQALAALTSELRASDSATS